MMEKEEKQISANDTFLLQEVFHFLRHLSAEYPDFSDWYWQKVVPGLRDRTRIIRCLYVNHAMAGVIILKNTPTEKKICTLRVSSAFQKQGIGERLLARAITDLQCDAPLVTVPQIHYDAYNKLFRKAGFVLCQKRKGYYKENSIEYVYNGFLEKQ